MGYESSPPGFVPRLSRLEGCLSANQMVVNAAAREILHRKRSPLFGVLTKRVYMYPLEFWHAGYGDAIWAESKGLIEAFHDRIFNLEQRVSSS